MLIISTLFCQVQELSENVAEFEDVANFLLTLLNILNLTVDAERFYSNVSSCCYRRARQGLVTLCRNIFLPGQQR
jgi:hypothetical protein